MSDCRSPHDEADLSQIQRKKNALRAAILLSFLAFIGQIFGAVFTGSLSLLGDTAHLFADLFSLAVSLVAITLAARPATHGRSFGLYRLEVLAAFLNGVLLVLVGGGLVWEAIERLRDPSPVKAGPLIWIAAAGMAVNLVSAWLLSRAMVGHDHGHGGHGHSHGHGAGDGHGHAHSHSHSHEHLGHSHEHQSGDGRGVHFLGGGAGHGRGDGVGHELDAGDAHKAPHHDRNLQGALAHVLSDALGSLAVVLGAVLTFFTNWAWVDPVLAILLSVVILRWSFHLLLDSGHVLLEGTPRHIRVENIIAELHRADARVGQIDDLHVWEITSRMYAATAEITVGEVSLREADELRLRLHKLLREKFGIAHVVLALKP